MTCKKGQKDDATDRLGFLYPSLQSNIVCFNGIPHTKNSYVNQRLKLPKWLDGLCVGFMVYHILFNFDGFSALQIYEMSREKVGWRLMSI